MIQLTKGEKNIVDTALGAAGAILASLAANAASLPTGYQAIAAVIGIVGGYFVSDAATVIGGGVITPAIVTGQLAGSWAATKPLLAAEIAKLPPIYQTQLNNAISLLDTLAASQSPPA